MWSGEQPAGHVIALAEHLTLNPLSRVFAIRGGAPELQGWDAATVIAARTHNLLAGLIAGLSKGMKLDDLLIEYPGRAEAVEAEAPKTIAEFSAIAFTKFMHGGG